MPTEPRLVEALNAALHDMMDRYEDLHILGEDIADPYGGAFKVTKGLTTRYPDRVLSTPISESAIVGVANGLALCGNRVIVEIMFGDFVALAFDQIVNFAAKSVTMYGRDIGLAMVIRCPVGGRRGYGPTHSQSLQKHFVGVPGLDLYELSTVHDPAWILETALSRSRPAIVFEQKVLYAERLRRPGVSVDGLELVKIDDNWVRIRPAHDVGPARAILIAGGAISSVCMAAQLALAEAGLRVDLLVPARTYPLTLEPVLDEIRAVGLVAVAEESTAGGTWGAEVSAQLHTALWGTLRRPVRMLHSADSVIPAAVHLEHSVLLQAEDIAAALLELTGAGTADPVGPPGAVADHATAGPAIDAGPTASTSLDDLELPRFNTNDSDYILLEWLVADGALVAEGDEVAEVETSKTVEVLTAPRAGVLYHRVAQGAVCRPGQAVAAIGGDRRPTRAPEATVDPPPELLPLPSAQRRVARVVAAARREIPDAFVVRQVGLAALDALNAQQEESGGEPLGLLEVLIAILGELRAEHPLCYATLQDDDTVRLPTSVDVAVTIDAGSGLYLPVVRQADRCSLAEIGDELASLRMGAFRGRLTERQLSGANIAISWNHEPKVVMVEPVIQPGLACVVSVAGRIETVALELGRAISEPVVNVGLAHDHRIVNGSTAVAFLAGIAGRLEDKAALSALVSRRQAGKETLR